MSPVGLEQNAKSVEIHQISSEAAQNPPHDSDLSLVVNAWPQLDQATRDHIVSQVRSNLKG